MKIFKYLSNIKGLAIIAFIAILSASCKKLIQIPANPSNEIPTARVFADSADIMGAVAGIYNNFGVTSGQAVFLSGAITIHAGLSADELAASASASAADLQFYVDGITANNPANESLWSNAYSGLYQVNACLEGISSNNTISASLKQQLIGEIKVVRALYYFNLVNLYGPVPLVITTDYKVTQSLPRAPVTAVYAQVIADLTDAQKMLTADYPSPGRARPNLYVADALLAKVYLYNGQWQNAETMAIKVINSGAYSLNTDLNTVFLDGSNEAIWQLPANGNNNQTPEASAFIPFFRGFTPSYSLNTYLLNAFETGDQRLQDWTANTTVNGKLYYYPYKYKNRSPSAFPAEDYMISRLGEIYLIRAEAQAQSGGSALPGAIADLNMIRRRAGLPDYTGATDQASVLAAIYHERQVELFCEWGNRWYDLKRTNTINTVLGAEKPGWQPTDALYPVPLPDLQNNPFLTQNPGY